MTMKTMFRLAACCIMLVAFMLTGCSGGGGGGSVTSTPTVSGVASEGALILGKTVRLKDAKGKSLETTSDATSGFYSFNVSGLTAPFLITITSDKGTYVSLAKDAGTANINPITTTVVVLAAGSPDPSGLFANLIPAQLTIITTNYSDKAKLVTDSLRAVLPSDANAESYFTGAIIQGTGLDKLFDIYQIVVNPTDGITVKTKETIPVLVLTIPAATVQENSATPLPAIVTTYAVALGADTTTQTAGKTITLTAEAKLNGAVAPDGTTVTFTATGGTLSAPTATTTNGKATVTITAATAGTARVTATAGLTVSSPLTLTFDAAPVNTYVVGLSADKLTQQVGQNITVTADAKLNGAAVADGTVITFAASGAALSAPTATTKGGKATVTVSATTAASASITASVGTATSSPLAVTFTAAPVQQVYAVTLTSDVATQVAGQNITLTAQATLNGAPVADGTTVTFTSSATLSAPSATTTNGKATVTITAAAAATPSVTATVATKTSTPLVLTFTAPPVQQVYTIALGSDRLTQVAGQNITLTADAKLNGVAVPNGTIITFTNAGGTLSAPTATTINGKATVTITASVAAIASTTATVGTTTSSALALTFTAPVDVYVVNLTSDKLNQVAGQNITLTATATRNGAAMPDGTMITFATNNGTLSAATAAIVNGKATVTITAAAAGSANVTAAVNSTTTSPLALTFTAPPQVYSVTLTSDVTTQVAGQNITLTADAKLNGAAVPNGTTISFITTGGVLSGASATTINGKATVTISAVGAASANVTATVGGIPSNIVALTFTVPVVYTQAILKLKTVGTLAAGKLVGGWQTTVKMPASGISIKTKTATNMMLDATAFFKSGLTPITFTFNGSFNKPDATSTVPYVMISNAGDFSDPLAGTVTGEVATLVFDIAAGTATPAKADFALSNISIAEAAIGAPALAGVTLDFDISYK